ncbi:MAG: hypothetical protein ACHREM_33815, partial [Polyangiales bacterium]
DLRFALGRTANAYRQLAAAKADGKTVSGRTGSMTLVDPSTTDGSKLPGAKAVVGGVAWGDLHGVDVARAGGFQEASSCRDYAMPSAPPGAPTSDVDATFGSFGSVWADYSATLTFQNSFAIGQQLRRRLVALQDRVAGITNVQDTVGGVTQLAVAEAGTWAGTGVVYARGEGTVGQPSTGVLLLVAGFTADDLPGVADSTAASATALGNDIVLVYGEPWVAECAAHTTGNCPKNFDADYVQHASRTFPAAITSAAIETGFTGPGLSWVEFAGTLAPQFKPVETSSSGVTDQHLYVIFTNDKAATPGVGRVVGAVGLHNDSYATLIDSPLHNELLKATLGVAAGDAVPIPEKAGTTTATSPSYCIPGVPRDMFVPLQNDLTADSDPFENSWRQYLTLAQAAATNADTLGQQLIRDGLDQDLRREGAQQQLTQICGDVADTSKVSVGTNGQVQPSSADSTTQACLDTSTIDVVMLTTEPASGNPALDPAAYPGTGDAVKLTTWLKKYILQCDPA